MMERIMGLTHHARHFFPGHFTEGRYFPLGPRTIRYTGVRASDLRRQRWRCPGICLSAVFRPFRVGGRANSNFVTRINPDDRTLYGTLLARFASILRQKIEVNPFLPVKFREDAKFW